MKNYLTLFIEALNNENSQMALVENDRVFDAKKIRSSLELYVNFIKEQNILPRERVVFLGNRSIEAVIYFHALLLSNLVPVLIDRSLPEEQIAYLAGGCKIYCVDKKFTTNHGAVAIPSLLQIQKDINPQSYDFKNTNSGDESILFVTHTSGTTGTPKKVAYTNMNIAWAVNEYAKLYDLKENGCVLFALPFHYCFGFIACCLSPLSTAGKVVLLSETEQTPLQIAETIQQNRVNVLVINPFFYSQLCKLDLSKFDFSSLRICDSGGEILPIEVIKKFQSQTSVLITEGYGLTETSSLTHFLTPDKDGKIQLGSVGKPCPGVDCMIINEDFKEVETGEIGELLVKGPMVIKSYDDPQKNEGAFYKNWFRTGDLFYRDNSNYYYLVGRKKDAVSIPNAIHELVSKHVPAIIQQEAVGDLAYKFIDKNQLVIYVVPRDNSIEARKSIENSITSVLPTEIKSIAKIKFVGSVPRTASGKVQKQKLEG